MITRLHVENYRAFSDFTLELGPKTLLMGLNGSGKSSVFDVLAAIRDLVVEGEKCENVFPLSSIPRWLKGDKPQIFQQRFELDFEDQDGPLRYELVIEQNQKEAQSRVLSERLTADEKPLFELLHDEIQTYKRDHTKGPKLPAPYPSLSAIGFSPENPFYLDGSRLKRKMRSVECLRVDPSSMNHSHSEREERRLKRDLSNFPSWYRSALTADLAAGIEYLATIKEVIGGMESLDLEEIGQGHRRLRAAFACVPDRKTKTKPKASSRFWLYFDELSEGQRVLIALYAILHFLLPKLTTFCIDEPDNFIALAEIQPWLFGVLDRVDESGGQVVIASHHPELINMLAPDHGIILERDGAGPITARKYKTDRESKLAPAERVARGWEHE